MCCQSNNSINHMKQQPTKQHIQQAHERIQPYIHSTPLISNPILNSLTKSNIFFKLQNLQKTGSFKVRGVTNTVLQLQQPRGICTHSSGNNAQALAYVGKQLNIPVTVVMPRDSPVVKKSAVKDYGAKIIESTSLYDDRVKAVKQVVEDEGFVFVSSSDDMNIITGNATVSYEMYKELDGKEIELDYILFPIGGGGIAGGSILTTKYLSPKTKAIGVEPELAQDAYLSWKSQQLHAQLPPITVADGLRTRLGEIPFQIISRQINDIILVSQTEIINATKLFMEKTKMMIQTSSAVVLAAIMKDDRFREKNVGAIITGGNIDLSLFFKDLEGKYGSLERIN